MALPPRTNKDCVLAWEAMPDALQGALTPHQQAWLDGHLASCDACRGQFEQQRRLQRALRLPPDPGPDMEAGLQQLLARIDAQEMPAAREPLRSSGWAGRALVAAVLVQAIGLGVLGARLWTLSPAPAPEYRTLSQDTAPLPAGSIRLVPDPAMPLADWDALLQANALRVVAGPNAVGAYTVVPFSDAGGGDALLQRLRSTRGIRLAEPVAGAP